MLKDLVIPSLFFILHYTKKLKIMASRTIKKWVEYYISKYNTKEDFKIDLDRVIKDLIEDKESPNQLAFYKRIKNKLIRIEKRLEELRTEIIAERISTSEIIELQSLVKFIDSGDVLLLQWAGVKEKHK